MRVRRLILLSALIGIAVFPFGWLTAFWPPMITFNATFLPNELAHNLGHFGLFGALGFVLLASVPWLRQRPGPYLAGMLAIGLTQEGLQLLYKRRGVAFNDLSDLLIDLMAAMIVFLLWQQVTRQPSRASQQ